MGIPLQRLYHRNGRDAGIGPVADANFFKTTPPTSDLFPRARAGP